MREEPGGGDESGARVEVADAHAAEVDHQGDLAGQPGGGLPLERGLERVEAMARARGRVLQDRAAGAAVEDLPAALVDAEREDAVIVRVLVALGAAAGGGNVGVEAETIAPRQRRAELLARLRRLAAVRRQVAIHDIVCQPAALADREVAVGMEHLTQPRQLLREMGGLLGLGAVACRAIRLAAIRGLLRLAGMLETV